MKVYSLAEYKYELNMKTLGMLYLLSARKRFTQFVYSVLKQ